MWYDNKVYPPADPVTSFDGRTILVTGSNVGLGFEAAAKFAALGASQLILGVRNLEKGAKAKEEIEQRLKSSSSTAKCTIEVWQLDMNSYESIQAFAARAEKDLPRLDIAVLNAGVWKPVFESSDHGWEETLQVNVLSTSLLALLLLPKLKETKHATGITPTLELVSSGTFYKAVLTSKERTEDGRVVAYFNQPDVFNGTIQYRISKLFQMATIAGLAEIVGGSSASPDVTCLAVCPGLCRSDLSRALTGYFYAAVRSIIWALAARTTEQGSRTIVSGTALGEKAHGQFWQSDVLKSPPPVLSGEEGEALSKQIWSEILDALAKDVPDVKERAKL